MNEKQVPFPARFETRELCVATAFPRRVASGLLGPEVSIPGGPDTYQVTSGRHSMHSITRPSGFVQFARLVTSLKQQLPCYETRALLYRHSGNCGVLEQLHQGKVVSHVPALWTASPPPPKRPAWCTCALPSSWVVQASPARGPEMQEWPSPHAPFPHSRRCPPLIGSPERWISTAPLSMAPWAVASDETALIPCFHVPFGPWK